MQQDAMDTDLLGHLAADKRLSALDRYVPRLSIFSALGLARQELAHSRLLATLLDPAQHAGAEPLLRALIVNVGHALAQCASPVATAFGRIAAAPWSRTTVTRERFRVDILIEIESTAGTLVLGLENKIDAGESAEQLARYQEALFRAYPRQAVALAFLCPAWTAPASAQPDHAVPCVAIDYVLIASAIRALIPATPADAPDYHVLREIHRLIQEDILKQDDDLRQRVRELWNAHPKALALLWEHRPRLADIADRYEALIAATLGMDVDFDRYPSRGELRELKFSLKSWEQKGYPFTFMFRGDDGELPSTTADFLVDNRDDSLYHPWHPGA